MSSSAAQLLRLIHCSMPRPPNRRRAARKRLSSSVDPTSSLPIPSDSISSFSSDPSSLSAVIDLHGLDSRLRRFLSSADDAFSDLRTLVSVDHDRRRLVVSCRRSTVLFTANALLLACLSALALRLLLHLALRRHGASAASVVVRRDRSLGGREVVVSTAVRSSGLLSDPLSPPLRSAKESSDRVQKSWARTRLPKWWPANSEMSPDSSSPVVAVDKESFQREADRLIRAITDNRMNGKDIAADEILQLRQICKASGVRVSFDTTNTRDSFYRTSVDFVLNVCARAPSQLSSIQVAGEDVRKFIAGLSDNIGLENIRAARIISAAVAARTRSRFLQAWALEMQGKHAEAMLELSKICITFRIFPPEESSAEMEMVARGLEKYLKLEQREFLMDMLAGLCEEESRRTAAEALGLMPSSVGAEDQF